MRSMMSLARQHAIPGLGLIGRGYFPALMPAHQVERPTGYRAKTCGNRSKARGLTVCVVTLVLVAMQPIIAESLGLLGIPLDWYVTARGQQSITPDPALS